MNVWKIGYASNELKVADITVKCWRYDPINKTTKPLCIVFWFKIVRNAWSLAEF